ncbi:MAG: hypothetical protein JWL96_373 [Sphingomonas bacterium]|uniref:DUF4178 domain-containing protein n=1 Tax=Sphingomonas bacterium TaxID=1895847 RepID=UPI002625A35E|nr:DUF4178 domain-containing protein [Sphingomonas bacterium]MDB5708303.1 hypothetical protein [Sphingomonas bacterium]
MNAPASTVRVLSCPNCGGSIALRAAGASVSLICEYCGSTLDATSPDLAVIVKAREAMLRPEIALGTRATLRGEQWEVVGFLERTDGESPWSEYLLFNPYAGYAFLVDDGRRFSLGRLLDHAARSDWLHLNLDGDELERFGTEYTARVTFVVGEFYWRVGVGEEVRIIDHVRPGVMLSCEKSEGERIWTRLDMLALGEAEDAFGIARRRTDWSHPSPHEPSPWRDRLIEALIIGAVAMFTLIVIAMMASGTTQVAAQAAVAVLDGGTQTAVIHNIVLRNARNRVVIDAQAGALQNAWVDVDYSLVEQKTQENYDAYALAEHYNGRDSDGSWSEGDTAPSVTLSSIPRGTYDLVIEMSGKHWVDPNQAAGSYWGEMIGPGAETPVNIGFAVSHGGVFGGNLILCLLLIAAWPAVIALLHLQFESRRKAYLE